MLDSKGFDLWADGYDKAVGISDEENTYPFAGYKEILGRIYKTIMEKPGATVLDIGFGTGTLTAKLYENGCNIYGQDFSSRMIELASAKMPDAHLFQGDITNGLAVPLLLHRYDFIVATYSLHHLTDEQKKAFLQLALDGRRDFRRVLLLREGRQHDPAFAGALDGAGEDFLVDFGDEFHATPGFWF